MHDTDKIGESLEGNCGYVLRAPLDPPQSYPDCAPSGLYDNQMVLSGIWLDILAEMHDLYCTAPPCAAGLEAARQLHVDWSMIMNGGESYSCSAGETAQAAHPQTLVEVLTADDDDGNLGNGTPHGNQICTAFALHGIPCNEFAGPGGASSIARLDCDRDRVVTVQDVVCFHRAYAAGSLRADCDGDGRVTVEDASCFHRLSMIGGR